MVVTFYIAWWFLDFFDGFFSPLYDATLGFHAFGEGRQFLQADLANGAHVFCIYRSQSW